MKKIIFVDDDNGIQDSFKRIFSKSGYDITILSSGESLLEHDFEVPDLFVLDKQLRGVSGLDLCRFLKGNKATQNVPVILVSAAPHIHAMASEAGADASIEKPFRIQALRQVVATYLNG